MQRQEDGYFIPDDEVEEGIRILTGLVLGFIALRLLSLALCRGG